MKPTIWPVVLLYVSPDFIFILSKHKFMYFSFSEVFGNPNFSTRLFKMSGFNPQPGAVKLMYLDRVLIIGSCIRGRSYKVVSARAFQVDCIAPSDH